MRQLKHVIEHIYLTFIDMHEDVLERKHRVAPMVLHHLYGSQRFPAGGGIANEKAIYDIARMVHYNLLVKKAMVLMKQVEENGEEMETVLEYERKPMRLI